MVQIVDVILVFLLFLLLPDPAVTHYVPSPCYKFTITPKPSPGQPWCEVQGQFIRDTFFNYTCSSQKVEPIGPLGMMLNATEAWNQHGEHWKDLVEELRKALLHNQEHISKAFHSPSLQGCMMCQQKFSGHRSAFWEFGFSGQRCLRFESKSKRWTEWHPGCRSLKETLDSDRYVTNLLVGISRGDCAKFLNQSTVLDTKAAPTMAPAPAMSPTVSATPTVAPGAARSEASTNRPVTSVIPVILAYLIIGCVLLQ